MAAIDKKHGPFELCISVGDVFSADSSADSKPENEKLLRGDTKVPVPTLVLCSPPKTSPVPLSADGGDIVSNLLYLGSRGLYTTQSGLKIAYLSSQSDSDVDALVKALGTNTGTLDLLLLASAPPSVGLLSPAFAALDPPLANPVASPALSSLLSRQSIRYVVSPSQRFFEREPFAGPGGIISRVVLLGPIPAAKGGERWHYAANLVPAAKMAPNKLKERPGNATPSPFTLGQPGAAGTLAGGQKRPQSEMLNDDAPNSFFYGEIKQAGRDGKKARTDGQPHGPPPEHYTCHRCNQPGHWIQDCPTRTERGGGGAQGGERPLPDGYVCRICGVPGHRIQECPQKADKGDSGERGGGEHRHGDRGDRGDRPLPRSTRPPQECWFCLSSPTLSSHLLISIGGSAYLAAPKGPIRDDHVLVVPVGHVGSVSELVAAVDSNNNPAESEEQLGVLEELGKYLAAVRTMEATLGNTVIGFEVNAGPPTDGRRQAHMAFQLVPVPSSSIADKAALEEVLNREATRAGLQRMEGVKEDSRWEGVASGVPVGFFPCWRLICHPAYCGWLTPFSLPSRFHQTSPTHLKHTSASSSPTAQSPLSQPHPPPNRTASPPVPGLLFPSPCPVKFSWTFWGCPPRWLIGRCVLLVRRGKRRLWMGTRGGLKSMIGRRLLSRLIEDRVETGKWSYPRLYSHDDKPDLIMEIGLLRYVTICE